MEKKTLLTGDRPTGPLHIGHYFGSLVNRVAMQSDYETFIMVADVQALTDNFSSPERVRENVMEVAIDNIAAGLDPKQSTLFIQSQIPQIAELTVFYSNLVTVNTLRRNPTVKAEIAEKRELFGQEGESVTFGFLGYPVSQAADITFCRAHVVPVGEDQLPMIELTREIVERFHRIYNCDIFPLPQAKLSESPRIMGLDGSSKMSKSLNNAIYLKDNPEETMEKIKSAKTDSGTTIEFNPRTRPEISNLVLIYSLIHNQNPKDVASELKHNTYSDFKIKLAQDLNRYLRPIREKRLELESKPHYIKEILEMGRSKALNKAEETLKLVREAMKINY
ncbi:MAG: tryptophan--tRNA ligase [Candidatus Yanofskybacteria bacterium RIFCSPHIGHO2_01_FULL_48_25b]|uniref:Tryptophan--tRNA ligase n=1 Tax=Candidatus Yanofskybacteria bacterium RIFCSPHIGHO2_01_FULL_48_25b TaxID=1802672 RepID=A0A1F8F0P9_9BACT|nr:MAG: tryptophan--tRNA ligase [Candidatus Yanofskybacteria bacterium RIFCSPHIGHO2_01_FULL_48_25b]